MSFDSLSTFSSPKAADVNGDAIMDIVVGAGFEDDRINGVFALDGSNGDVLWFSAADNETYGAPVFLDVNNDTKKDVIVNGRTGNALAINVVNGELLWNLKDSPLLPINAEDGFYHNVFTPQILPDVNSDGTDDLLFAYGGGGVFSLSDSSHHAYLLIVSGKDGQILKLNQLPTNSQVYMAPVLLTVDGSTDVIVGCGGERHGGPLFRIPIEEVIDGSMDNVEILAEDSLKGFIQSPVLVDINDDAAKDIIVANLNQTVYAIDGRTNAIIWKSVTPDLEIYSGITPGHFNDDDIVDFSILAGVGSWALYSQYRRFIIDGASGQNTLIDTLGDFLNIATGISYSTSSDPDHSLLIYTRNYNDGDVRKLEVIRYNGQSDDFFLQYELYNRAVITGSPYIGDLDDDGLLDFVVAASDYEGGLGNEKNRMIITRRRMNVTGGSQWNGVMGNETDGCWTDNLVISAEEIHGEAERLHIYPNPFTNQLRINFAISLVAFKYPLKVELCSADGRLVYEKLFTEDTGSQQQKLLLNDLENLPTGIYWLIVNSAEPRTDHVARTLLIKVAP